MSDRSAHVASCRWRYHGNCCHFFNRWCILLLRKFVDVNCSHFPHVARSWVEMWRTKNVSWCRQIRILPFARTVRCSRWCSRFSTAPAYDMIERVHALKTSSKFVLALILFAARFCASRRIYCICPTLSTARYVYLYIMYSVSNARDYVISHLFLQCFGLCALNLLAKLFSTLDVFFLSCFTACRIRRIVWWGQIATRWVVSGILNSSGGMFSCASHCVICSII